MCDTVVVVDRERGVWLAKNSDREPGEAQLVEHLPRRRGHRRVRCTHVEIDDVDETFEIVIGRPFWMWGAEMGVNEVGVAIGNEAVFTRARLDVVGLTGMDLVRIALERCATAKDAVETIARLVREHGQGGRMGYRNERFSYSSSFIVADAREAWIVETAGRRWVAERVVEGVRAISNALTIRDATLVDDPLRGRDFVALYDRGAMSLLAGASTRRACTTAHAGPSFDAMADALRDHAGHDPRDGVRMATPCAHASPLPTRTAGQTTGSMIAHLSSSSSSSSPSRGARVWMTGTSSPCLSVFKPVPIGSGTFLDAGPEPGGAFDDASLWWRHERLHRAALAAPSFASSTAALRERASSFERAHLDATGAHANGAWSEHRALVDAWRALLPRAPARTGLFARYWRKQSALDGVPA